jgi:saccharopine dehydrogenase-like NADP-dependent oxidoreductase
VKGVDVNDRGILIAGGYGVVVGRIAAELAPDYPDRIVIAGRSFARAAKLATTVGHGARGRQLDVTDQASIAEALKDVGVVVSCIDQPGRKLLWASLRRGLGYTDITPHLTELGRGAAYDEIVAAATTAGARLVLGTGIVPGISNVIVRALADRLGGADDIETALVLSAGDVTGSASFDYFLRELTMVFSARVNGEDQRVWAFTSPRRVRFPDPIGEKQAYLFPFSDQVLYPRTMAVRTALTRLAIEPAWLALVLDMLTRTGASRLLATRWLRHAIARTRKDRPSAQGARFALRVDVRRGARTGLATLVGQTQADAAAAGAAGVVRALLDREVAAPGAWMPEQVIAPDPFLLRLARKGLQVRQSVHDGSPANRQMACV